MKMSQQHHTIHPQQFLMQLFHRQVVKLGGPVWSKTPNCLVCARVCTSSRCCWCKKRKVMCNSEMRGSFYNGTKRGQLDGAVEPHEGPKSAPKNQNTASSLTSSPMTAATTRSMSTTPLSTPPLNLRRRLTTKRPAAAPTDCHDTVPCSTTMSLDLN